MGIVYRVPELELRVSRAQALGFLGFDDIAPSRVLDLIEELWDHASRLPSPTGVYRVMSNEEYSHSHFLCHIGELAVGMVTLGDKIDSAVQEFKWTGDLGRAAILDAFGSAALESAADTVAGIVTERVEGMGLRCGGRFSPGRGGWNIEELRWIFPALEAHALGVTLAPDGSMRPRKTLAFALTIGDQPIDLANPDICEYCGMFNCRFKHRADRHPAFSHRRA